MSITTEIKAKVAAPLILDPIKIAAAQAERKAVAALYASIGLTRWAQEMTAIDSAAEVAS